LGSQGQLDRPLGRTRWAKRYRVRRMPSARRRSPAVSSASSRSTALSDLETPRPSMASRNHARSGCRRSINTGRRRPIRFRALSTPTWQSMAMTATVAGPQITTTAHFHQVTEWVSAGQRWRLRPEWTISRWFTGSRDALHQCGPAGGDSSGPRPRWLLIGSWQSFGRDHPSRSVGSTCALTLPCAAFGDLGGWTALVRWKIQQVVERCLVQHDTRPALGLMPFVEVAVLDTRSHSGLGPAGNAEHRDTRPRIHAEDLQTHPARPRGNDLYGPYVPRDRHAGHR
jgi:hypothetical protein